MLYFLSALGGLSTLAVAALGALLYRSGQNTQKAIQRQKMAETALAATRAVLVSTHEAIKELEDDLSRTRNALHHSEEALASAHEKLAQRGDAADVAVDIRDILGELSEMPAVPAPVDDNRAAKVHGSA